jgi:uncharacterized protein
MVSKPNNLFRLNVGFIAHESVGYSREFLFEHPTVHLHPDLDLQDLIGSVRVARTAHGLLVKVEMQAFVEAECVRCLSAFSQPLQIDFTELYAFSPNAVTDSELLLPENGIIDLAPLVREEMLLAVPISPLCSPDCQGICPVCGENLNETVCSHEDEEIDPRMSALKALLDDS